MANLKEALKVIEDVINAAHKAVKDLRAQQAAAEGQGVGELVAAITAALDTHVATAQTFRAAYEGLITASDMTNFSEPNPDVVKATIAGIVARETSMDGTAKRLDTAQKALVALQSKAAGTAKDAKDTLTKLLPAAPTPPSGGKDGTPTPPTGGKDGNAPAPAPQPPKPAPAGDKPAPAGDKPKKGFFG